MALVSIEGEPYHRKGRWFMQVLIMSLTFCAMLPYIAVSMIMGDIMTTFGCDMGTAGLAMMVQLVMSGVCMFIGSFISDRIGLVNTAKLGICALAVGALIQSFSPSIVVFIVGRAVAGFGQGMTVSLTPLISSWFDGKERSVAITANSMGSMVAIALSTALVVPLSKLTGSWQGAFLVYAVITVIFAVLWLLFGRSSPEGEAQEKAQREQNAALASSGHRQSSLSLAIKDAQCWKIMIFFGLFIIVDTARATFLPTFMGTVGVPSGIVTSATSILSIAGMAGSLLGGFLATKLWARKPNVLLGVIGYIVAGLLCTFVTAPIPNAVFVVLLGFFYNIPITSNSMLLIEHAMVKNPMMISGGVAMMSGVGMLLTLVVSPIFNAMTEAMGMAMTFRVFFLVMIIGVIAVVSMKETGRKPEQQAVQ